jgi:hypothetical protein
LNQDPLLRATSPRDELVISLADLLAPLRRRWRLILLGTGICWAILLLFVLLTPPTYHCEGTLALPDMSLPTTEGNLPLLSDDRPFDPPLKIDLPIKQKPAPTGVPKAGIPLGLYKNLQHALSDGAAMGSVLKGRLPPLEIERMLRNLGERVSPVSSGARDDIQRLDRDDMITAIKLSYESPSAALARDVVAALAGLVRETLITGIAMERIEAETIASNDEKGRLLETKIDLLDMNRSLQRLAADLERLAREMPDSSAASPRELVDTRGSGHLFLPLRTQLAGTRARYADNEHRMRICDQTLARLALRQSFLGRVEQRMKNGTETFFVSDAPGVIGSELQDFLSKEGLANANLQYLQSKMETLRDNLAILRTKTRFIQFPTVRALSRTPLATALASLALLAFIAGAFVIDLWRHSEEAGGFKDEAHFRKPV